MRVDSVIDVNYGDSGKGLCVNWLANQSIGSTCVVRHCSGAQAGHSVEHNGMHHVFSTYSSGTLAGADTYLSKHFIHNPILFDLERKRATPQVLECMDAITVYAHGYGRVTTPFDMWVNHITESSREKRHGSCGVGIHATMVRHEVIPVTLYDLHNYLNMHKIIKSIHEYYEDNGIDTSELLKNISFDTMLNSMQNYTKSINMHLSYVPNRDVLTCYDNVIFESAQGLLLDQDHEFFPHVTHAKTGSYHIPEIIEHINTPINHVNEHNTYYVTRAYMTRHGNGPFPTECPKMYETMYDNTNLPHEYQGILRYGLLDLNSVINSIKKDLEDNTTSTATNIVITCLDQMPDKFDVVIDKEIRNVQVRDINSYFRSKLDIKDIYYSYSANGQAIIKGH